MSVMRRKDNTEQDNEVGEYETGETGWSILRLITIMWDGAQVGGQVYPTKS